MATENPAEVEIGPEQMARLVKGIEQMIIEAFRKGYEEGYKNGILVSGLKQK